MREEPRSIESSGRRCSSPSSRLLGHSSQTCIESKERAEETGATKVAKSHYLDREDKKHSNISPRRYFCMQCHVPQFDAKPLVENTYKPAAKKGE